MNKLSVISIPVQPIANPAEKYKNPADASTGPNVQREWRKPVVTCEHQSGKLHSRLAGYIAFGTAAVVSLMAAATVASYDVPLVFGGF